MFLVDFGVNFLPVGTPGASRAPLGDQVVSQTDFVTVFRCPGDALWCLWETWGLPWSDLGRLVGAKSSEERVKKKLLVHTACPSRL